jgi:hypothetical protein
VSTQREKVLEMLEQAGPQGCDTADFLRVYVPRFSARIQELRAQGKEIETERIAEGRFRYTLTGEAPPVPVAQSEVPSPVTSDSPGVTDAPSAGALFDAVQFDVDIGPVSALTGEPVPWKTA